jgi:hypothetical protein
MGIDDDCRPYFGAIVGVVLAWMMLGEVSGCLVCISHSRDLRTNGALGLEELPHMVVDVTHFLTGIKRVGGPLPTVFTAQANVARRISRTDREIDSLRKSRSVMKLGIEWKNRKSVRAGVVDRSRRSRSQAGEAGQGDQEMRELHTVCSR